MATIDQEQRIAEILKEQQEIREQEGITLTKKAERLELIAARIQANTEFLEDQKRAEEEIERIEDRIADLKQRNAAGDDKRIEKLQKELKAKQKLAVYDSDHLRTQIAALKNAEKIEKRTEGLLTTVLGATTGLKSFSDTLGGDMLKNLFKVEGELDVISETLGGIGTSAIQAVGEQTWKMVGAFDAARVEVNKATGQIGKYDEMLEEFATGTASMSVGLDGAAQATAALSQNMSSFSSMSQGAAQQTVKFTAELEKLGVDAATTSQNLDFMIKGLGMTSEEAQQATRDMVAAGQAIGIATSKMASDWQAASSTLAVHGDKAQEVFLGLAATAKATGVEMNTLLGIAGQFDTFDSAAAAASKFNQILGGPVLNSVDLMTMSENDRNRAILEGVRASGKSWESMNRFEQQALANAAGIQDMAEASKFFNTAPGDIDKMSKSMDGATLSEAEMEQQAFKNMTAQEKFNLLLEKAAVFILPIANGLSAITETLLEWNDALGGALIPILGILTAIPVLIMWLGKFKVGLAAIGIAGKTAATGSAAASGGISGFAKSMATAGPAMIKGGIGLLAIAGAIAIFAASIWLLSDIGVGTVLAIGGVLAGFAIAMALVGSMLVPVAKPVAIAFGVLALAMLAIAAAFIVFNIGFEPFVAQVERLAAIGGSQLSSIGSGLISLGTGFGFLGVGLAAFSVAMLATKAGSLGFANPLEDFAFVVGALGDALGGIAPESAMALATVFSSLTNLGNITALTEGIGMLASALFGLSLAMMLLSKESVENFKLSAEGFVEYVDAGSKITEPMVENVKRFVDESVRYRAAKNSFSFGGLFGGGKDEFVDALKAGTAMGTQAGAGTGNKTIIMQVNGRELGRVVDELISKKYSLSVKQ